MHGIMMLLAMLQMLIGLPPGVAGQQTYSAVAVVLSVLRGFPAGQEKMAEPWEELVNQWQPPEKVMDAIGLEPGMVVGEVGAGRGRYTVRLAARVGPTGLVYANDIDPDALNYLARRCRSNGLENVTVIAGRADDPGFPSRALDMVFMINVYNSLEDPVRFLRNTTPALKPEGRLAIVLVDPVKYPVVPKRSATREQFLAAAQQAGYVLEKEETFLVHDGIYVLRPKRTL
jgi:ubiquinone/menaquinone biosynthesis C-methylase UbiE